MLAFDSRLCAILFLLNIFCPLSETTFGCICRAAVVNFGERFGVWSFYICVSFPL